MNINENFRKYRKKKNQINTVYHNTLLIHHMSAIEY